MARKSLTSPRKRGKKKEYQITHKEGEKILCDLLKVDDLDVVRELLREESLPRETKHDD